MKKLTIALLAVLMVFGLTACLASDPSDTGNAAKTAAVQLSIELPRQPKAKESSDSRQTLQTEQTRQQNGKETAESPNADEQKPADANDTDNAKDANTADAAGSADKPAADKPAADEPQAAEGSDPKQLDAALRPSEDATVLQILEAYCQQEKIQISVKDNQVTCLNGIANTPKRAWQYSINGKVKTKSPHTQGIKSGDHIVWTFAPVSKK